MPIRTRITDIEHRHIVDELMSLPEFAQQTDYLRRLRLWLREKPNRNPQVYADLCCIQKNMLTGLGLKIRGQVKAIAEPTLIPIPTDGENEAERMVDGIVLTIQDDRGFSIESFPIINHEIIDKINRLSRQHSTFDFIGFIMPRQLHTPAGNPQKRILTFFLFDLLPSETPLQLVKAKETEIVQAKALADECLDTPGGLLSHIKQQLVASIGIRGLDKADQLDHALDFMILQALSDGYEQARSLSLKLHSLVIGAPAVGKKLITQAAKELNPVYQEADPAKVTVAGLNGAAGQRNGTWVSDPGLVPLAHGGVFAVQDFHSVDTRKKREIMPVLSMVMEDGVCRDTTTARTTHHALTSIHLDMNKRSDVHLVEDSDAVKHGCLRFEDINIPMNVLTRFDFIIDIQRDTIRQLETALEMHGGSKSSTSFRKSDQQSDEMRQLKVLIAYLRSEYAVVEIPAEISAYARRKHEQLLEVNRDQLQKLNLLGDFQTRIVNGIDKLVFAIARGNARAVACRDDVDRAFRFVQTKMEFIASIEPFTIPEEWGRLSKKEEIQHRREFILKKFAGQEVKVSQVFDDHQENYNGPKVTEDTIRTDLEKIAIKPRHGYFRVPKK